MEKRPAALLLKFPGTNCDGETDRALRAVGFDTDVLPISLLNQDRLRGVNLLVLSGGFSYGDYIMAGKLAQLELQRRLGTPLKTFHQQGGFLLGICNGFQILMRLGLLPKGSLMANTNGRFICRWVELQREVEDSLYLQGLPRRFEFPIAHAEGRFVAPQADADRYLAEGLVALRYVENVNGSVHAIAGLQDETRRVFGLMPHPERCIHPEDHYDAAGQPAATQGWGFAFFKSIHDAILAGR